MGGSQQLIWRPRLGRVVPHALAIVSFVTVLAVSLTVPTFHAADRAGLIATGAAVAVALYFFGRCQLRAGPTGLTVVNILRTTELDWAQVVDARMERGDPWPALDLTDGTTIAAMGIQAADGDRAQQALARLRALIAERSTAPGIS